jgi:hypothetical protein
MIGLSTYLHSSSQSKREERSGWKRGGRNPAFSSPKFLNNYQKEPKTNNFPYLSLQKYILMTK